MAAIVFDNRSIDDTEVILLWLVEEAEYMQDDCFELLFKDRKARIGITAKNVFCFMVMTFMVIIGCNFKARYVLKDN